MRSLPASTSLAVACGLYLGFGMTMASLGPGLPDLARNTAGSLAALGSVFTALFAGGLVAQLVTGPLNDRVAHQPAGAPGQRLLLLVGALLFGLGILGVTASRTLPLALGCAALAGLGHGTLVVTGHVFVARLFPARATQVLNLLDLFFGIGAVVGPALVGVALQRWGTTLAGLWAGAALLLGHTLLIPFLAAPGATPDAPRAGAGRVLRAPVLWLLGVLLFVYIGLENGMAGWTPAHLERATGLAAARAALATSGFWLALTGGRLLGVALGTRLAPASLLAISLSGAVIGGALLVASSSVVPAVAAVAILGFCLGPVFPTTLAITASTFPRASGTATSVVVAVGMGGGVVLPWLQGVLLERQGPRASALLVLAGAGAMLAICMGYRARKRRSRELP